VRINRNLSVSGRNLSVLSAEMSALLLILILALIGSEVFPSPVQAWGNPVGLVEATAAGDLPVESAVDHTGFQPGTGDADPGPVTARSLDKSLGLLAAGALLMLVFSIDN